METHNTPTPSSKTNHTYASTSHTGWTVGRTSRSIFNTHGELYRPSNASSSSRKLKTTSDDLRDVVFNFRELEDALEGRYNSPCVLKMLREVRPTVHPVCGVLA